MKIHKNSIFLCILFFFPFFVCYSSPRHKKNNVSEKDACAPTEIIDEIRSDGKYSSNPLADSILTFAFKHLHKPYCGGSAGPNSFDCSGFTSFVYGHFGYQLERSSGDQTKNGVEISKHDLQPGDLVFFKGRNSRASRIGHVGMVVSVDDDGTFSFIHSACQTGVSHDNSNSPYYERRYVTACRIIDSGGAFVNKPKHKEEVSIQLNEKVPETVIPPQIKSDLVVVEKGQTLFSISKKSGCTVNQIRDWNDLKSNKVTVGQKLRIDSTSIVSTDGETIEPVKKEQTKTVKSRHLTHTVKAGETLFQIAKNNNCTVDDIRNWNNLESNNIHPDQKLIIGEGSSKATSSKPIYYKVKAGETISDIADEFDCTVKQLKQKNGLRTSRIIVGQKLKID